MMTANHGGRKRGGVGAVERHVSTAVVARVRDWPDGLLTIRGLWQSKDVGGDDAHGVDSVSQPTLRGPKSELGRQRDRSLERQQMGCVVTAPLHPRSFQRGVYSQTLERALMGNVEHLAEARRTDNVSGARSRLRQRGGAMPVHQPHLPALQRDADPEGEPGPVLIGSAYDARVVGPSAMT